MRGRKTFLDDCMLGVNSAQDGGLALLFPPTGYLLMTACLAGKTLAGFSQKAPTQHNTTRHTHAQANPTKWDTNTPPWLQRGYRAYESMLNWSLFQGAEQASINDISFPLCLL